MKLQFCSCCWYLRWLGQFLFLSTRKLPLHYRYWKKYSTKVNFYPANEMAKVIVLVVSVNHSLHGGEENRAGVLCDHYQWWIWPHCTGPPQISGQMTWWLKKLRWMQADGTHSTGMLSFFVFVVEVNLMDKMFIGKNMFTAICWHCGRCHCHLLAALIFWKRN